MRPLNELESIFFPNTISKYTPIAEDMMGKTRYRLPIDSFCILMEKLAKQYEFKDFSKAKLKKFLKTNINQFPEALTYTEFYDRLLKPEIRAPRKPLVHLLPEDIVEKEY